MQNEEQEERLIMTMSPGTHVVLEMALMAVQNALWFGEEVDTDDYDEDALQRALAEVLAARTLSATGLGEGVPVLKPVDIFVNEADGAPNIEVYNVPPEQSGFAETPTRNSVTLLTRVHGELGLYRAIAFDQDEERRLLQLLWFRAGIEDTMSQEGLDGSEVEHTAAIEAIAEGSKPMASWLRAVSPFIPTQLPLALPPASDAPEDA